MSKKGRGLSFEEKRTRLLELFHESKDVFTLKELEKQAPKQKGIVQQSVKEVLDSLTSDCLVCGEKIGTSNYFWSFPGTVLVTRQKKQQDLTAEQDQLTETIAALTAKMTEARNGREDSKERDELQEKIQQAETELTKQSVELQKYADNDPDVISAKQMAAQVAKDCANRWTDNILMLQSYCRSRFNLSSEDFSAQFGLPEEFDNIA